MSIVVSLLADDLASLRRMVEEQASFADLLELRLDEVGHPGAEALGELVAAAPCPLIVTANGPEAFGTFRGGDEELVALLRDAAKSGAAHIDVDHRLAAALGEVAGPCRRIVSRHETAGTPDDLDRLLEEVRAVARPEDLIKVVTHAARAEDGMRVLHWLDRQEGVVAFCSGEAGRFTRFLAPIFGSPWTYAAPAGHPELATAPGQVPADELRNAWPEAGLSPTTGILGVVGNPVGHSRSPAVWTAALRASHLDFVYVAFEPEDFDTFLDLAVDPRFRGFSITIPFKERALAHAVRRSEEARRTGAANTLIRVRRGWAAYNTDVEGVESAVSLAYHLPNHGPDVPVPEPMRALVVGAGGAARAAVVAIKRRRGAVRVTNVREERARSLAEELGCRHVPWDRVVPDDYDVLIHATPVGMHPREGDCLVPETWLRPGMVVVDAVYRPRRTELLKRAARAGCRWQSGLMWFQMQAICQFVRITGIDPDSMFMGAAHMAILRVTDGE